MEIVIYQIQGRDGLLEMLDWAWSERDPTVQAVHRACQQAGLANALVTVRPWFRHLGAAIRDGAWRPPVVLVDGVVVSQGTVPDSDVLASYLRQHASPEDFFY